MDKKTILLKSVKTENIQTPWGGLIWYAGRKLGNTTELTLGKCVIKPGMSNTLHYHPNCSEMLIVMRGTIMHTTEQGDIRMEAGDAISIALGFPHKAVNIGEVDAELFVAFPTADRQVENE